MKTWSMVLCKRDNDLAAMLWDQSRERFEDEISFDEIISWDNLDLTDEDGKSFNLSVTLEALSGLYEITARGRDPVLLFERLYLLGYFQGTKHKEAEKNLRAIK